VRPGGESTQGDLGGHDLLGFGGFDGEVYDVSGQMAGASAAVHSVQPAGDYLNKQQGGCNGQGKVKQRQVRLPVVHAKSLSTAP
jgi:hypothetical protein